VIKSTETVSDSSFKKYMCIICGLIYDEALGWPDDGIPPGTRWDDVLLKMNLK
jgi:rubredoxin-NAD+ reductase